MAYKLVIPKKVQKDLSKIDSRYQLRIKAALVALASNPYLGKKLGGEYKAQRSCEVRPYRIIYEIKKYELIVLIIRIGHRQGVYY
jgi:mRNA interferase RelE/StbE